MSNEYQDYLRECSIDIALECPDATNSRVSDILIREQQVSDAIYKQYYNSHINAVGYDTHSYTGKCANLKIDCYAA